MKTIKLTTILALTLVFTFNSPSAEAQVCFTSTNYAAGSNGSSLICSAEICSADFNNDGKLDLAVTNNNTDSVSILLGTSNGNFGTAVNFAVGNSPTSVISNDFNGDGKADLAVTNDTAGNVSVLLGIGTGSFGAATNFAVGNYPEQVISADFNNDGKLDLATVHSNSNNVSVLLGNGLGNFGTAISFAVGNFPQSITSVDFNGDGKADLAVANWTSSSVSILLGTGAGSFGAVTNFAVGNYPQSVTSADFNNDGKLDLATASANSNEVSVLLGTGTGSFSTAVNYAVITWPHSVISADFNGDGNADLATANNNPSSNNVSILLGNGAGSFGVATNFMVGYRPVSVTSADFNGDGKADLATANQSDVSVLINNLPFISIISNTTAACAGSTTLTAIGASTYTWSTSATSASISPSPTVTTTYTVIGTGVNNCTNTASTTINVGTTAVPNICMVTTDSATNYMYNIVYWNKTLYNNVDSFIVYRYDVMSSAYLRIGAVSKNSLSEFTDNVFSIGGPNGGNPLYSSWQYKLAIRDTCGNIGAMSPYHQSMFVQESGATFSWNAYTVEAGQTNPVTGYSFLRDDSNTGAWHVLVNTAGLSTTDPNYATYPNGNWRVDALGFNCTPTLRLAGNNSIQSTYSKAHSNTSKPTAAGINQVMGNNSKVSIYPNPASQLINLKISQFDNEKMYTIEITDILGNITHHQIIKSSNSQIDVSDLAEGVYQFIIQNSEFTINKKVVIVR
ncbi:MAG: T9SS type A sorting domain-containing protein [Bacteroidia bacterium]